MSPERHLKRKATAHTSWCAQGHHCDLSYHRSDVMLVNTPGAGQVVATRVRNNQGKEWAEVTINLPLHSTETGASWQLRGLLTGLERLLLSLAVRKGITSARSHAEIDAYRPRRVLTTSRASHWREVA